MVRGEIRGRQTEQRLNHLLHKLEPYSMSRILLQCHTDEVAHDSLHMVEVLSSSSVYEAMLCNSKIG